MRHRYKATGLTGELNRFCPRPCLRLRDIKTVKCDLFPSMLGHLLNPGLPFSEVSVIRECALRFAFLRFPLPPITALSIFFLLMLVVFARIKNLKTVALRCLLVYQLSSHDRTWNSAQPF